MKVHDRVHLADALEDALVELGNKLSEEDPAYDLDALWRIGAGFQRNIEAGRYAHAELGAPDFNTHAYLVGHEPALPALLKVQRRMAAGEFLIDVPDPE